MQSIKITTISLLSLTISGLTSPAWANYKQTNLVCDDPSFNCQIIDPLVQNAWGLSLRGAGLGGHWWVSNANTASVTTYVGDVGGTPIFQDSLEVVFTPTEPGRDAEPAGQFFNTHPSDFEVTMPLIFEDPDSEMITGPAKFLVAGLGGELWAWTETEGGAKRPTHYQVVDDKFGEAMFFGMTGSNLESDNLLYGADFDLTPGIHVWDNEFNDMTSTIAGFANPPGFDNYAPFNIEQLDGSLYIAYAKQSSNEGEEETGLGLGGLAQFDLNGNLIKVWQTPETPGNLLDAPWGMAIAPSDFGKFSNALLVGNFGDGRIVGYDQTTMESLGYLEDSQGNPVEIDGLWDIAFGNGASLGEANHLYFAAGPNEEVNGIFGKLESVSVPENKTNLFTLLTVTAMIWCSKKCIIKGKKEN